MRKIESSDDVCNRKVTMRAPAEAVVVISPLPEFVTQRNAEAVCGMSPRVFLTLIRAPRFPLQVVKIGKLRIVDRPAFVAWLRGQTSSGACSETDSAVLAELGLGPTRGRTP